MNEKQFAIYMNSMCFDIGLMGKEIKGYKFEYESFDGTVYFYKDGEEVIYYCTPSYCMCYREYQENNNKIRINFQKDDGDYLDENKSTESYMPLTFDLETDVEVYYSKVEEYIDTL